MTSLKDKINKDKINNDTILGWCNSAKVSNTVSHNKLRWLGHMARMPNDRLPERVLFGHMDGTTVGLRGRAQEQWVNYVREDLHFAGLSPESTLMQRNRLCPHLESGKEIYKAYYFPPSSEVSKVNIRDPSSQMPTNTLCQIISLIEKGVSVLRI